VPTSRRDISRNAVSEEDQIEFRCSRGGQIRQFTKQQASSFDSSDCALCALTTQNAGESLCLYIGWNKKISYYKIIKNRIKSY